MRRIALTLVLSVVSSLTLLAQSRGEWLEYADESFKNEDYITAAYFYLKVVDPNTSHSRDYVFPYDIKTYVKPMVDDSAASDTTNKVKPDSTFKKGMLSTIEFNYVQHQIAESYRLGKDYINAELWYAKVSKNVSKQFPDDKYYYGLTLISNQKYNEALAVFESDKRNGVLLFCTRFEQREKRTAGKTTRLHR